jgi:hypothetical protein
MHSITISRSIHVRKPMLRVSDLVVSSFETQSSTVRLPQTDTTNEQTPDTSCFDCPVGLPGTE